MLHQSQGPTASTPNGELSPAKPMLHRSQGPTASTPNGELSPAEPTALAVSSELARFVRGMRRARLLTAAVTLLLGLAFVFREPVAWKIGLAFAGATVGIAVTLLDPWKRPPTNPPARLVVLLLGSLVGQELVLFILSGGIRSPALVLLPITHVLVALVLGRGRSYWLALAAHIAVVVGLAVADLSGQFTALRHGPLAILPGPEPANGFVTVLSLCLIGLMVFAGNAALRLRDSFDRALVAVAEAQQAAAEALRERNQQLVEITGEVAHELKNPLTAVRALVEVVERKLVDQSREQQRLGVVRDEVERMTALLEEFLNVSRPVDGLAVEQVSLAELLAKVVELHDASAAEQQITIRTDVAPGLVMTCDARKIQQVLLNLVQNALDAAPPNTTVSVTARSDRAGNQIEIRDEGGGLSDAVRGRLFVPGTTTKKAGSGLGLAIARSIAEQHGGTLQLRSRTGGGCIARLWLPQVPATVSTTTAASAPQAMV